VDGGNEHTHAVHHNGAYRLKAQEIMFVQAVIVQSALICRHCSLLCGEH